MTLDKRYVPILNIQTIILDKDNGFPLAGGKVYFYVDEARTVLKDVYELTGAPPNYSYAVLPNPITLSSCGSFMNAQGHDVVVFLFPYDLTGNIQRYYIKVESSDGVEQFTREGFPFNTSVTEEEEVTNYVPNPQFTMQSHIRYNNEEHRITPGSTLIAPGGWSVEIPGTSITKDYLYYIRRTGDTVQNRGYPRYYLNYKCNTADPADTYKIIRLKYDDVNKFASTEQAYTYFFWGRSNAGTVQVEITVTKYFGAGGSASTTQTITTKDLTINFQLFNIPIVFGVNDNKTIGANNDDWVSIDIKIPSSVSCDIELVDFGLIKGDTSITGFPTLTNYQTIRDTMAGTMAIPNSDGSTKFLHQMWSDDRWVWDDRHIGSPCFSFKPFSSSVTNGTLPLVGGSFDSEDYSTEGVPYRRLALALWDPVINMCRYGTRYNFYRMFMDVGNQMVAVNNRPTLTPTVVIHDGSVATGFTFNQSTRVYSDGTHYACEIITKAASLVTPGAFFVINDVDTPEKTYCVWYAKDGIGTKPTAAFDYYIKVDITGSDAADIVRNKSVIAINFKFFTVPFVGGLFPRMWTTNDGYDPDRNTRVSANVCNRTNDMGVWGDNVGTLQSDEFRSHAHPYTYEKYTYRNKNETDTLGWAGDQTIHTSTSNTGGNETRPYNIYIATFIYY